MNSRPVSERSSCGRPWRAKRRSSSAITSAAPIERSTRELRAGACTRRPRSGCEERRRCGCGRLQGLLGDDLLQAAVLVLERLQPLRLVLLQGAVAGAPAVEGLSMIPSRLQVCGIVKPLTLQSLGLSQLGHICSNV
jgi:hypothetical protein